MPNRVILDGIWDSKKLAQCSWQAQLNYPRLYLLTDDWACFEIDPEVIKGRTYPKVAEITLNDIESFVNEYEANGLLFVWQENGAKYGYFTGKEEGRLFPPSRRHKRQTPEPDKKLIGIYLNKMQGLHIKHLQNGYKEIQNGFPNPNPNPNPNPSLCLPSKDIQANVDIELTQSLIDGILGNNPEASVIKKLTPKRKDEWINQCRLLREADGRTPEQILGVIQFSQADNFWKGNILSMPKLREKWDQLFLKAKAAGRGSGFKRDEGVRYVKPTPAEEEAEKKLLAEYETAQKKFMEAKGYKTEGDIPFDEYETFTDFKTRIKRERR